jgi:anti-anti-sigma regulatory factor
VDFRGIRALRWLLTETGIDEFITKFSSIMFMDSTVAQALVRNYSVSDKTKHMTVVRELHVEGLLEYMDILLNPANCGTTLLRPRWALL